jgi:hypothetical protein
MLNPCTASMVLCSSVLKTDTIQACIMVILSSVIARIKAISILFLGAPVINGKG